MSDETKKVEDGGDAFPMIRDMTNKPNWDYHPGMSLRDWFAGMAMQGLISGCYAGNNAGFTLGGNVVAAYEYADAMIARRKR